MILPAGTSCMPKADGSVLHCVFTDSQADLNKKREAEIAKMRKEMEDQVMQSEAQIAQLRKKNNDAVNDLNDQLDQAQKAKSKYEF